MSKIKLTDDICLCTDCSNAIRDLKFNILSNDHLIDYGCLVIRFSERLEDTDEVAREKIEEFRLLWQMVAEMGSLFKSNINGDKDASIVRDNKE